MDRSRDTGSWSMRKGTGADMRYYYGMRLRGFSPMCQPMDGLIERLDDKSGMYHDILVYDRLLSDKEMSDYELDWIIQVENVVDITT